MTENVLWAIYEIKNKFEICFFFFSCSNHTARTQRERAGAQRGATSVGAHQQITLRDLWPACGHHDRKEQEVGPPPLHHHHRRGYVLLLLLARQVFLIMAAEKKKKRSQPTARERKASFFVAPRRRVWWVASALTCKAQGSTNRLFFLISFPLSICSASVG